MNRMYLWPVLAVLGLFTGFAILAAGTTAYELYAVTHQATCPTISELVWGIEDAWPPSVLLILLSFLFAALILNLSLWFLAWHLISRGQATGLGDWWITWNRDAPHKG